MSNNRIQSLEDLMREEEEARIAADTPERIAADLEILERNRRKAAAELESLQRQGLIDEGGDPPDDEEEDDEGAEDEA